MGRSLDTGVRLYELLGESRWLRGNAMVTERGAGSRGGSGGLGEVRRRSCCCCRKLCKPVRPQTPNRCGLKDGLFDMNVDHPTTCSSASDLSTHPPSPHHKRVGWLPQSEHVGGCVRMPTHTRRTMSGNACISDRRSSVMRPWS